VSEVPLPTLLAPQIVAAFVEGRQGNGVSRRRLMMGASIEWVTQASGSHRGRSANCQVTRRRQCRHWSVPSFVPPCHPRAPPSSRRAEVRSRADPALLSLLVDVKANWLTARLPTAALSFYYCNRGLREDGPAVLVRQWIAVSLVVVWYSRRSCAGDRYG